MGNVSLDSDGFPIPYNDSDIKDNDFLLRYVCSINHVHKGKVSSAAFCASSKEKAGSKPGMSTDWLESVLRADQFPQDVVVSEDHGIAKLSVEYIRKLDRDSVAVGQTANNDNPHHTDVWGADSKSKRRALQKHANYITQPKCLRDN